MAGESIAQAEIRLAAPGRNMRLWRNNVGVLLDLTGRPVRYGLANESRQLNTKLKSGDLIGWERVTITPDMVGKTIARFVSIECKPAGWTYRGDPHESAQKTWADLVTSDGGLGIFATGRRDL